MRWMSAVCVLLLPVLGCDAVKSTRPDYMSSADYQERQAASASLFASDNEVLHGETIEKILDVKVTIPKQARVAILHFGRRGPWGWWSEELAELNEDLQKGMIETLQGCPRVSDASLLPSLMMPGRQTIPHLRAAAARYQADLLLVYRSQGRVFDKQRLLRPDQVRARCVVEAILLDVRTGLVPFASVAAQTYETEKAKQDYGFDETTAKAELKAVSLALTKIGTDLAKFLAAIP